MRSIFRASIRASAVALFGCGAVVFASSASACGTLPQAPSSQNGQVEGANGLLHEAALPVGRTIVGLWSFKMTPTAGPGDFGYQEWHSDGTELENSGGRAPATENFCMGAWTQTGLGRYHLNHLALSYDGSGNLNAKVNIKEDVTVSANGMTFSGPFTLNVYDPNSGALVAQQTGQVTGQRINAN